MEKVVSFESGQFRLNGIIHSPPKTEGRVGVILLCPGYKHRVGQHRLYVYLARRLCKEGFHVLRFDFHGLGDSGGEIERCLFADFWNFVQRGGFVDDTIAAIDYFTKEIAPERIVLMGLCGGAITALLAAAREERVDGILPINIPVMLESSSADWFTEQMPAGLADRLLSGYLRRLLSPESWLRLLTFKSDYRAIWKSLVSKISRRLERTERARLEDLEAGGRLSPYFLQSFSRYAESRRPVLFLFSGNDKFRWAFESDFEARLPEGKDGRMTIPKFVVESANHSLTLPEWREALVDKATIWLREELAPSSGNPAPDGPNGRRGR